MFKILPKWVHKALNAIWSLFDNKTLKTRRANNQKQETSNPSSTQNIRVSSKKALFIQPSRMATQSYKEIEQEWSRRAIEEHKQAIAKVQKSGNHDGAWAMKVLGLDEDDVFGTKKRQSTRKLKDEISDFSR